MVQFVFQGSFCVLVNSELARINFTEMPYLIQEKNATNFSHHLGSSKDGISMDITNATNAEMSNAQSETSQPDLKENLLNVKVNRGFFFSMKYLSNDFQVFYNTLNQKMIKETKTYDPSLENGGSLWSSLGGVLSLFLGVSFAMLFEVWIYKLASIAHDQR